MSDPLAVVNERAAHHGFEVVGVTSAAPLEAALAALEQWCDKGYAGPLHYMDRDPPQRADARTLLKSVRSIVTLAVNHWVAAPPFTPEARYGRVARYAWGRDYHDVVIPRLRALGADLVEALPGATKAKAACDHSPFLERAAAARAGLGFPGKNTCLILPRRGSFYFLGEVLLDVELPNTGGEVQDHCGTCTDCLPACPTNAFEAPYVLDARRCISYLTIEHQGAIPRELREPMGAWLFGCDDCQDVCPFNRFSSPTPWPEFTPEFGVGPRIELSELLEVDDDDAFATRFAGTPLLRPGRVGLLRNAAVVARNVGAGSAVSALAARARQDADGVVRSHALWALAGLDPVRARRIRDAIHANEQDPHVLDELERLE